jgi:hypothetical protein
LPKGLSSVKLLCNAKYSKNTTVTEIYNSGCCGMAGSFGYEKEHYQMPSMQMGRILFKGRTTDAKSRLLQLELAVVIKYLMELAEAQHPVSILVLLNKDK